MPRKRRASTASLEGDEEDFAPEEKYNKDHPQDVESCRAPRNAANARERARMRVLSKAFCRLKTTLPWVPADTKLSKLDTLRLAATYIAHLRAILRDDGDAHPEATRSLSLALSWPFALQGAGTPMVIDKSCNASSSASASSSPTLQYRGEREREQQTALHELQCSMHHTGHQNIPIRHNHESQLPYY